MNTLYYGDNLEILREYIEDESVDLIYLDPPFQSARDFNVLFRDDKGYPSEAQIEAFQDTWNWDQKAQETYHALMTASTPGIAELICALRGILREGSMLAYLVMMTSRLVELHRILKPTGSLFLHCDTTASHYLKVVLDAIFGQANFRGEIVWKRQSAHSDAKTRYPDVADILLFYARSKAASFTPLYTAHDPEYVANFYRFDDGDGRGLYRKGDMASPNPRPNLMYAWRGFPAPAKGWRYQSKTMQRLDEEGRIWYPTSSDGEPDTTRRPRLKRYLSEQKGSIVTNIWTDIAPLHGVSAERLGYPTQKPLALLERILLCSTEPDDVVLDPFCGCGTTIAAAQKLGRQWIGIDITSLAIAIIKRRMEDSGAAIRIVGEPKDLASARDLAERDRYQFQWWALSLLPARPMSGVEGSKAGKKGADKGIDGVMTFEERRGVYQRVLVQVKSGNVKSGDIRDLRGTLEREGAAIGVFVTLSEPTKEMRQEAASAGFYHSQGWGKDFARIQILTIAEALAGRQVAMPAPHAPYGSTERVRETMKEPELEF